MLHLSYRRVISYSLIRRINLVHKIFILSCLNNYCNSDTIMSGRVNPILIVHGGAGDIPESGVEGKLIGVKKAAKIGYQVLHQTDNVLDAIEAAIQSMEDDEAFNAGKGSVLNLNGEVEMEALITEGKHLNAGAATLLRCVEHPISIARLVMEKTPHTFLGGDGLESLITSKGIKRIPEYSLITQKAINALEKFKSSGGSFNVTELGGKSEAHGGVGTVGCVAVDRTGHVASGTSTGGINGKYKGRIGDTPLPGCGGYSDDEIGAVSTTGYGESIMRFNLAHRILANMQNGKDAQEATKIACEQLTSRVGNTAGAITVSNRGEVGISFTSKRMAWAYQINDEIHFGINPNEHLIEKHIT